MAQATTEIQVKVDTSNAERNITSLQRTLGQLKTAFAGLVSVQAAQGIAQIADQATNLRNRLTVLTGSQSQANSTFRQLVDVANNSRTPLAAVGELYARITQSTQQMGLSQSEALEITDTINKALVSTGVSAAEAAGPLLQLGQAFSSGTLRGEELNSILEGMPVIARAIADSLGVPIGALKTLGEQGAISSRDVVAALKNVRGEIVDNFGQTTVTIGQSFTVLQNSIVSALGELDRATGASESVAQAILSIAKNIEQFARDADAVRSFVDTLKEIFSWVVAIGSFFAGGLIARGLAAMANGVAHVASTANMATTVFGKFFAKTKEFQSLDRAAKFLDRAGNKVFELSNKTNAAGKEVLTFARGKLAVFLNWMQQATAQLGFFAIGLSKSTPLKVFSGALAGLAINFKDFFERIWTGQGALSSFEKAVNNFVIEPLKTMGGWAVIAAKAVLNVQDSIQKFIGQVIGIPDPVKRATAAIKNFFSHPKEAKAFQAEVRKVDNALEKSAATAKGSGKVIRNALAEAFQLEHSKQLRAFQQANQELIKQADYQRSIIGLDDSSLRIREAQNAALNEQRKQLDTLKQKHEELKEAAKQGGTGSTAEAQLLAFEAVRGQAVAKINAEYAKTRGSLVSIAKETNKIYAAELAREAIQKNMVQYSEHLEQQLQRQRAVQEVITDLYRDLKKQQDDLSFERAIASLNEFDQRLSRITYETFKEMQAAIEQVTSAFGEDDVIPDSVYEQIEEIKARYGELATVKVNDAIEEKRRQESFAEGWKQAFEEYYNNANNAANKARTVFNSVTSNLEDALVKFATTGKLSFKDFAQSVIQDLIRIETRAAVSRVFKGVFGGASAGGSILGSIFGFADGGMPPVGKASIVGERGPELFVPKTAGTIVPNHALGGAAPVTNNTYITNNINAIDAKGVAQLFAENRKSLLGSVEQARKELPVRGGF